MREREKKNTNVPQRAKFLGNNLPKGIQQQDILLPLKIFLKEQSQIRKWFYFQDKEQHNFHPVAISRPRKAKLQCPWENCDFQNWGWSSTLI